MDNSRGRQINDPAFDAEAQNPRDVIHRYFYYCYTCRRSIDGEVRNHMDLSHQITRHSEELH